MISTDRECSDCAWERAQSLSGAAQLIADWLRGTLAEHPGHGGPPDPETHAITDPLLTLTACGVVPVGSQPGTGHADAPPAPGATLQRAYLNLIGPPPLLSAITATLDTREAQWRQWPTNRPARERVPSLDMAVTVEARTEPPDNTDPYLEANLATYLDPTPYTRYLPAGMHTPDGSLELADLGGLDPRVWKTVTRARSGWRTADVLARLTLTHEGNEPLPPGQLLATTDLACSLAGSASLTLVDTKWGRGGWLATTAAEAATTWLLGRVHRRHH